MPHHQIHRRMRRNRATDGSHGRANGRGRSRWGVGAAIVTALWLWGGATLHAAQVTVFAAASLSDALKEIGATYEKTTGTKVVFNFGGSSLLARQIEEGAPADVFFSADEAKMDGLERQGLLLDDTRKSKLSNALVIVVAADNALPVESAQDLVGPAIKRVALAEPRTVPAGIYAKMYLERIRLWSAVELKVVSMDNVRGALSAVEAGNAEAGIVYQTDAAISKKVRVAYRIPAKDTPKISYPMAVIKASKQTDAARKLLKHLESDHATRVFLRYGFRVAE